MVAALEAASARRRAVAGDRDRARAPLSEFAVVSDEDKARMMAAYYGSHDHEATIPACAACGMRDLLSAARFERVHVADLGPLEVCGAECTRRAGLGTVTRCGWRSRDGVRAPRHRRRRRAQRVRTRARPILPPRCAVECACAHVAAKLDRRRAAARRIARAPVALPAAHALTHLFCSTSPL